jgi:enoyl-CoA hydratase/carnithine racemase
LTPSGWHELERLVSQLAEVNTISLVLFRGAARTFSAGSDLTHWAEATEDEVDHDFAVIESALQTVENTPVPTIAIIEGVAAGAGCELALACDLRLMTSSARVGMPIVRLGILVSPEFALRLTSLVGIAKTRELLYMGRFLTGKEAREWGIANAVVDDAQIEDLIADWVGQISRQPRRGLMSAKTATAVALEALRAQHESPQWRYTDHPEFQQRVHDFIARR